RRTLESYYPQATGPEDRHAERLERVPERPVFRVVEVVGEAAPREAIVRTLECGEGDGSVSPAVTEPDGPAPRQDRVPRVPCRPKDWLRWHATWQHVKDEAHRGKGYAHMTEWLRRTRPELRCSPDTMADIVAAGHAGLLDQNLRIPQIGA